MVRGVSRTAVLFALGAVALAGAVFLTSCLGVWLTRFEGRIASLWLANAVGLAFLLRLERRFWPLPLAAILLGNVVANLVNGDVWHRAAALAACNIVEVVIAGLLLSARFGPRQSIADIRFFGNFVLVAGLVAPVCSAVAAAGYLTIASGAPPLATFATWYAADALGLLILTPLLLSIPSMPWSRPVAARCGEPALLVVLVAACSALVLSQDVPVLFAILPVLVLVAFRATPAVAALTVAIFAGETVAFTLAGFGPVHAADLSASGESWLLQAYIAVAMFVTLSVNAVITERNRLGAALLDSEREKRAEAEALAEAKSNFLATMSHEIRTPMTGVLGMIELLSDDVDPADRAVYVDTLRHSANLLMAILDEVLDFTKIDSGRLDLDRGEFDLIAVGQSTVDLFFNAASRKGVLLTFAADADGDLLVTGDRMRLQQVMSNFISNAIKFTDRGTIRATLRATECGAGRRRWRFAVRDSGIGIAAGQQAALFEPFVQVRQTNLVSDAGTGLGLAISKRLIEAMGGVIGCDSVPGAGATFWFEVELDDGRSAAACSPAATVIYAAPRALNILVAEDNPVNQMLIQAMLRRLGHRTTMVANGLLAIEAAESDHYDCILMDMQMPEMDGLAATRAIRAGRGVNATAPIIALTADASLERRRFYENVGLTDFLTKPINAALLASRLNAACNIPAADPETDSAGDAAQSAVPSFDPGHLASLRAALGPRRLGDLLQLFEGELRDRPAAIHRCLDQGDLATARREGHSLKGAAGSVGATGIATIAAAIEAAPDSRAARSRLADLDRSATACLAELDGANRGPLDRTG